MRTALSMLLALMVVSAYAAPLFASKTPDVQTSAPADEDKDKEKDKKSD
jgi:hypothetical protein